MSEKQTMYWQDCKTFGKLAIDIISTLSSSMVLLYL